MAASCTVVHGEIGHRLFDHSCVRYISVLNKGTMPDMIKATSDIVEIVRQRKGIWMTLRY